MNVRIDGKSVRFRILPEDLKLLLEGRELGHTLRVGPGSLEYKIIPAASGHEMELSLGTQGLVMTVPLSILEQLRDIGRSKNGISVRFGDTEVSLQIDLKAQAYRVA